MNLANFKTLLVLFYLGACFNALFGLDCTESTTTLYNVHYFHEINTNKTIISHFQSFDQLKSNCSNYNITNFVEFLPKQRLILNDSFVPNQMFTPKQTASLEYLQFLNLKGFDIEQKASIERNSNKKFIYLFVFSSRFSFYSNNNLLDSNQCDLDTFSNGTMRFLNSFDYVKLVNVKYPNIICPYVFKDSSIILLLFSDITNSFLFKNRLTFQDKNDTQIRTLKVLILGFKYETLDEKNLNRNLFKYTFFLSLNGVLNQIQKGLFARFVYLKNFDFQLDNLREFFHASSNEWLSALNSNVNVNMTLCKNLNLSLIKRSVLLLKFLYQSDTSSFTIAYKYPNEDCVYSNFSLIIMPCYHCFKIKD
jgi:hypothetical protein